MAVDMLTAASACGKKFPARAELNSKIVTWDSQLRTLRAAKFWRAIYCSD